MKKRPIVVGNWKMELSHKAELELIRALKNMLKGVPIKSEVVVCPSYPSLPAIAEALKKNSKIAVGAQNVFLEEKGAYTGQVSVLDIKPFVNWSLVGHSEVRAAAGVTDDIVVKTAAMLRGHNINPIVCIGESEEERRSEQTVTKIRTQVASLIEGLDRTSLVQTVIAYEPIWAIGSGQTPDPDDVAQIVLLIRRQLTDRYDQELAERVRIIYGGSVTPENAGHYVGGPNADGLLIGGASLHPQKFMEIIQAVDSAFGEA
ncbi:MAG: triose-phosphate isomerase [Candidatus Andersenbacteria bacterium]|nr:triose-phosphate isomerase [Candidatus Andersenbacteria bacterium]MBI3251067.1 triose-phosphate isomerase [Candidatus Andersenbacteria bacterium]